jgi:hypothetical protein
MIPGNGGQRLERVVADLTVTGDTDRTICAAVTFLFLSFSVTMRRHRVAVDDTCRRVTIGTRMRMPINSASPSIALAARQIASAILGSSRLST